MADYVQPERTTWYGDPALLYRAEELAVVVLPARGGKIASIEHHGREWLTQPQRSLLPLDQLPEHLVDGDMFGWDECAPTIDDCDLLGRRLPVHGDVWDQSWVEQDNGWLAVRGRCFDYLLRRRLCIRPDGFRLDYSVTATQRMPFLWAAHPQFAASAATEVVFGDGTLPLVDIFDRGYWTNRRGNTPILLSDLPTEMSGKLFVSPERTTDRALLVQPDGSLLLRWDGSVAPYLGVWMDRAGIGPVETIAIEPMTGYADSCALAARTGRVLWLEPDRTVHWWVDVGLTDHRGQPSG